MPIALPPQGRLLAGFAAAALLGVPLHGQAPAPRRPVTVQDMIGMTRISGHDSYTTGVTRPAIHSHSGDRFLLLVQRGDLATNTVIASLLLFRADQALVSPRPDTLLVRASSTNRPAIASVQWLPGDTAVTFLTDDTAGKPQVHLLQISSRAVRPLTRDPNGVEGYTLAPSGDRMVYATSAPRDTAALRARAGRGFVVSEDLRELLAGEWNDPGSDGSSQLFVAPLGSGRTVPIRQVGLRACSGSPQIAVTGRHAVTRCELPAMPAHWREYEDGLRGFAVVPILGLLDLESGMASPLLDVPWYRAEAEWTPDGTGILVRNTLLPFAEAPPAERQALRLQRVTAMIDPVTRSVAVLARRDSLATAGWDRTGTGLVLRPTGGTRGDLGFRRAGSAWSAVPASGITVAPTGAAGTAGLDLFIAEDLNTPPKVVATGPGGRRGVVFDPNPQFTGLAFGREEILRWQSPDGEWEAGLYYPVGYTPGRRYPLVIQTHGFSPDRFQIEGYAITGYAGQALAGQGFVVLQVGDGPRAAARRALTTPDEGPFNQRGIEAVIDTLDQRGLIDRQKVGLQGWSRTTFHVRHLLASSSVPFAAALISDGVDFSYLRYLADGDLFRASAEGMNGGIPVGDTFRTWQERIPTLQADRFKAPVRIESIAWPDGGGPLTQWELYTLLRRLNKPVEMVYYPEGVHNLVKPGERLTSQGGAVDWFRFWLKGEEDSDPAKAEQYARWRRMRDATPPIP